MYDFMFLVDGNTTVLKYKAEQWKECSKNKTWFFKHTILIFSVISYNH